MKSNEDLHRNVVQALTWEPILQESNILVSAFDGAIRLSGTASAYAMKAAAITATKAVVGVKNVDENISIVIDPANHKSDTDLQNIIEKSFFWLWDVPNNTVKVAVNKGWVTLSGALQWEYQKQAASNAVSRLVGIRGVTNDIIVR